MSGEIIQFKSARERELERENLKLRMVAIALFDLAIHATKAIRSANATEFEDEHGLPFSEHIQQVSLLPFIRDMMEGPAS